MKGVSMTKAGVVVLLGLWAAVALAAAEWKAPTSAKTLKAPASTPNSAKLGAALFQENCVICHGKTGKGDGEAAQAMNPRPKALTDRAVQAQTDGELFWKISEGREAMPGWKSMSEKDRWSLVQYLRLLPGKK